MRKEDVYIVNLSEDLSLDLIEVVFCTNKIPREIKDEYNCDFIAFLKCEKYIPLTKREYEILRNRIECLFG